MQSHSDAGARAFIQDIRGHDCSMISIIEGRKEAGLKLVSSRGRDIYAMLQLD